MRTFATETEARQFFVEKIVQQAEREGISLREDERQMLSWCSRSVLDAIMAVDPRYEWREQRGVIVVGPIPYTFTIGVQGGGGLGIAVR